MDTLKMVFRRDVQPAIGCTEPVAVALACCVAAQAIRQEGRTVDQIEQVSVVVDPGAMKNGMGVVVPNSNGVKGLVVAAALGAATESLKYDLTVLQGVDAAALDMAHKLVHNRRVKVTCDDSKTGLYIRAQVKAGGKTGEAIIENSHTNFTYISGGNIPLGSYPITNAAQEYGELDRALESMSLADLIQTAINMDSDDLSFAIKGARLNMELAEYGRKINGVGQGLASMMQDGSLPKHPLNEAKMISAFATDARMAGASLPAMSSGGSGNQGIVAILTPYLMGRANGVDETTIARSIGLSHLINSQIKCHTGHLSAMCGCAVAAGAGATAALVFQRVVCPKTIGAAINSLLANLTGTLCDGAKASCALKVINAVEAAVVSANLALRGFALSNGDGIVESEATQTIVNLGRICGAADSTINQCVITIMGERQPVAATN